MTEKPDKPLSPAMQSALQAVARMKGDSAVAWLDLLIEDDCDNHHVLKADPRQWRG